MKKYIEALQIFIQRLFSSLMFGELFGVWLLWTAVALWIRGIDMFFASAALFGFVFIFILLIDGCLQRWLDSFDKK